jgi:8-oxo-dGTP pyrophosphatase MutT (NUDIX family)
MFFNFALGIQEVDKEKVNINNREAVRAIILKGNYILMVHTNKGDYKFPGGGVNKEESHSQALIREVKEETGYTINYIGDMVGVFTERKSDDYEENSIFEMISYYYLCEISDDKAVQNLDDYEAKLNFQPNWILIDEAIRLNDEIIKQENTDKNSWVYRETKVLIAIKERYLNLK